MPLLNFSKGPPSGTTNSTAAPPATGRVNTHQQFLALTWGRDKQTQVTARHGWGHEGYQTIGNGNVLVDLASHETHLNLRHWLGPDWGLSAEVERYSSPYYRRTGGTLGLFWELP